MNELVVSNYKLIRYWEEASSGRDFVIILTVVVLYQVKFLSRQTSFMKAFRAGLHGSLSNLPHIQFPFSGGLRILPHA